MPISNFTHSPVRSPVRVPTTRRWPISAETSYSETLVSNGGTKYLTRGANLTGAANGNTQLIFISGQHASAASTNENYLNGNGTTMRARRTAADVCGSGWDNTVPTTSVISLTGTVGVSTNRFARLIAMDVNGTSRMCTWVSGSWTSEITDPTGGGVALNFTAGDFKLLASDTNTFPFNGSMARIAIWQNITLPDIALAGVQDNFINVSTGATVDPATSVAAYGTPIVDFYGSASDWNAGTNKGSGGNFTAAGTGSFT